MSVQHAAIAQHVSSVRRSVLPSLPAPLLRCAIQAPARTAAHAGASF